MLIGQLLFYLFSSILIISSLLVVFSRHPVHSVLFLILAFINAAGLFILASAQFLAIVLVMVYVGAVAVFFLFVIMMLDVDFYSLKTNLTKYAPIGIVLGIVIILELIFASFSLDKIHQTIKKPLIENDILQISRLLYTDYLIIFVTISLILLVAMIGAIVLTYRKRSDYKRQDISSQKSRTKKTVKMVKM